ncbi:DUF748 domain-containing protein [Geomesophilobacter sediminis]|uniref:AsmA family protein n=1 Tax=Geomesophilobacter sediminis TaxID=2798584 RepID=A0A8J7JF13_9BACT|nr:AsmA family protein [Geomesophilobacter sediminis]MBJ6724794.1 AsmA family protein [Geomesophilobacter sediminis]
MSEREYKKGWRARKPLLIAAGAFLLLILFFVAGISLFLSTSLARDQVARRLSDYLQEKVSISDLSASPSGIRARGVSIANPAGFPGELATVRFLEIAPNWGDLIRGKRTFRVIAVDGVTLDLAKNREGTWNYAHLQRVLAAKKPSPKETYIDRLSVDNGAIRLQGKEWHGISVKIRNFAAKGSLESQLAVVGEDAGGNRYSIAGKLRPGKEPVVDVRVTAADLALKAFVAQGAKKEDRLLHDARGNLDVRCTFQEGAAGVDGTLYFSGIRGARREIAGKLTANLSYATKGDEVRIVRSALTINKVGDIKAAGALNGLRKERSYDLVLTTGNIALAPLLELIPQWERMKLTVAGSGQLSSLHLKGRFGQGMPAIAGRLNLAEVSLQREGKLFFAEADAAIDLTGSAHGFEGKGLLTQKESRSAGMVQNARLPVRFVLSEKFKPVRAEASELRATVLGIPLTGNISFDTRRSGPLAAKLQSASVPGPALNPWLARVGTRLEAGTVAAAADLSGPSLKELHLSGSARLSAITGARQGTRFELRQGSLTAHLDRITRTTVVRGTAELHDAGYAGKKGSAAFAFNYRDRRLTMDKLRGDWAGTSVAAARLEMDLAPRSGTRLPLQLRVSQCDVSRGNLAVSGLSGTLRGGYNSAPRRKWLDGNLALTAGAVSWQGTRIDNVHADVAFSQDGARGNINAVGYGGAATATVSYDPFRPDSDCGFDLALRGGSLPQLYALAGKGKGKGAVPTAGSVDAALTGTYRRGTGLSCMFRGAGKDVALAAKGKTIVSHTALTIQGGLDPKRLTLEQATAQLESGARLEVKGTLEDPLTPGRKGVISLQIPQTAVNAIFDPLANALPRFLQEGTVTGSVGGSGTVTIADGRQMLAARLSLKNVGLEFPSQKLVVTGVDGEVPISLDLSGKTAIQLSGGLSYSRANFKKLLADLKAKAGGGAPSLVVEKIALGSLETGKIALRLVAREGTTEISSLATTFYGGPLVGTGSFSIQNGIKFRNDLLVDDLSLKQLCGALPAIQGYISGRVNGILSVAETGRGAEGMMGFIDLWAHKGGGEKMLVSREFLQRLSKRKISGLFLTRDRPYDQAEIKATLEEGFLTFDALTIKHTNLLGVRDIQVSIAPTQNRIELQHLFSTIKEAASRSKAKAGKTQQTPSETPSEAPATEFKWAE